MKKTLLIVLLAIFSFVFIGCNNKQKTVTIKNETDQDFQCAISFCGNLYDNFEITANTSHQKTLYQGQKIVIVDNDTYFLQETEKNMFQIQSKKIKEITIKNEKNKSMIISFLTENGKKREFTIDAKKDESITVYYIDDSYITNFKISAKSKDSTTTILELKLEGTSDEIIISP